MSGTEHNPPTAGDDALSRVAGIFHRARERNLVRAEELAGWVAVAEQDRLTADDRVEAKEVAHQLAGSAGTFGYHGVTELAREVETLFAEGEAPHCWVRAREHVAELVRRLHEPPESGSCPDVD